MRGLRRTLLCALCAALVLSALGASSAQAATFTPLVLQNGWTNGPFGTYYAGVSNVAGVVHFQGAIATTGSNPVAFTLPAGFRPATAVYVPVDLCNATHGDLFIQPSGVVTVQAEGGSFSNAACFTSLDGASFAVNATGFTALTLVNGWTNAPFGTSNAAVKLISGVVYLKGAIATTGSNPAPFTLPAAFRPATDVYVPVDLCNATHGDLFIQTSGTVTIRAEGGAFSNAACFTALDGVSFAVNATGFTALTLLNGWSNAPFGTSDAGAEVMSGVVHLKGAIATAGSNPVAFTLPVGFRPATAVYVPVDLCNATHGDLFIQPNGTVTVRAQGGAFSNAACFTALDGATFAPSRFKPLVLQNGWSNGPFGTYYAGVSNIAGVVHFQGAIATTGSNPVAFTLPAGFRPATAVYVPVDLCNASHGDLFIQPSGVVTVQAEGGSFSNAACFTSLDGASFALNATGFTALTLLNGWTNAPFGTSDAAVKLIDGVVHLEGAIATAGSNPVAFTLPAGFRPATAVYLSVDLCNATHGDLFIQPSGVVTAQAEGGAFSNAACFTSLDGASFALNATGFTALTLLNGWTNAPFGTSDAAVKLISGVVHLKGAIATAGSNPVAFTLPVGFRPATAVYLPVDLCSAHHGDVFIQPNGTVTIRAEGGSFSNAACFTSLDGATFAPST